jgi:hypothetical protein
MFPGLKRTGRHALQSKMNNGKSRRLSMKKQRFNGGGMLD